ncbi:MAG: hypothetical protein WDA47_07290 [Bacilli bacterium]|jgi:hypothetical protein
MKENNIISYDYEKKEEDEDYPIKYLKAIDDNKLLIVYKSVNFQEKKRVIVEGKINLAKPTEKVTEKRMNTLI